MKIIETKYEKYELFSALYDKHNTAIYWSLRDKSTYGETTGSSKTYFSRVGVLTYGYYYYKWSPNNKGINYSKEGVGISSIFVI